MKTEMTSVDIAAVVRELGDYEGAKFDKFYQYDDGRLRVKLRDYDKGRLDLIAETDSDDDGYRRLHSVEDPDDAPERPPDLPMLMRKRLSGGDLTRV
ncbi:MAG: NFACT family protein, partial [Halobacteria archaeon]|nr:NFACT family protein [Halobacteria archaeon]